MAGAFDDLIPAQPADPAQPAPAAGAFDDLIPPRPATAAGAFDDLIPTLQQRNDQFVEDTTFTERLGNNLARSVAGLFGSLYGNAVIEGGERQQQLDAGALDVPGLGAGAPVNALEFMSPEQLEQTTQANRTAQAAAGREIQALNAEQATIPQRPATQAVLDGQIMEGLKTDPAGVVGDLSVSSSLQSLPGLLAALFNPAAGIGVAGVNSFLQERGGAVGEVFGKKAGQEQTPDRYAELAQDQGAVDEAAKRGTIRGSIIAPLDALSMGLAQAPLVPARLIRNQAAREGVSALAAQPVVQAALGAGGETGAQLATDGKLDAGQIAAEALGEFGTAPVESGTFAIQRGLEATRNRIDAPSQMARTRTAPTLEAQPNVQTPAAPGVAASPGTGQGAVPQGGQGAAAGAPPGGPDGGGVAAPAPAGSVQPAAPVANAGSQPAAALNPGVVNLGASPYEQARQYLVSNNVNPEIPAEQIAQVTGLSLEDATKLRAELLAARATPAPNASDPNVPPAAPAPVAQGQAQAPAAAAPGEPGVTSPATPAAPAQPSVPPTAPEDNAPTAIWSRRYSAARGWEWKKERDARGADQEAWLNTFRKDEPGVDFIASPKRPAQDPAVAIQQSAAPVAPAEQVRSAAEWAAEMVRLRGVKPRPLNKLYGPNPTPEQAAEHAAKMKAWNAEYRRASAEQKKALERDNAAFRARQEADLAAARRWVEENGMPESPDDLAPLYGGDTARAEAAYAAMQDEPKPAWADRAPAMDAAPGQAQDRADDRSDPTRDGRREAGLRQGVAANKADDGERTRDQGDGERDGEVDELDDDLDDFDAQLDAEAEPVTRADGRTEPQLSQPGKRSSPTIRQVSVTDRPSLYGDAARELGYTPDEFRLLPSNQQFELLADLMRTKFGFTVIQKTPRMQDRFAVDQLLDAYRNLQFMASALGLPTKAIGLDGNLGLFLRKDIEGYFGAYYPRGTPRIERGKAVEGPTIVMPRRSNSFGHEWAHALDFHILAKLTNEGFAGVTGMLRRQGADFEPKSIQDALVILMDQMFADQASLALAIMQAEKRVAQARTEKGRAEAQAALDALMTGKGSTKVTPSDYAKQSAAFMPTPKGVAYYTKPTEMLARAFEAYIAHKVEQAGGTNEFITKGDEAYLSDADRQLEMVYPKAAERARIFAAFDDLFAQLAKEQFIADGVAAELPGNPDLIDPNRWARPAPKSKDRGALGRIIEAERESLAEWNMRREREAKRPKDPMRLRSRFANDISSLLFSKSGTFNMIEARYKDNPAVLSIIRSLREQLATDPGRNRFVGEVFSEAVERRSFEFNNQLANVIEQTGVNRFSAEETLQLDGVLRGAVPIESASPKVKAAASGMRSILDTVWYYLQNAGIDLGYARTFLPRQLDIPVVMADRPGFLRQASQVYGVVFDKKFRTDPEELVKDAAKLREFMTIARQLAKRDPAAKDIYRATRQIQRKLEREQGQQSPDPEKIQKLTDELIEQIAELLPLVREHFASTSAQAWLDRITASTFFDQERHGPENSFTKSRVLPPEADKLMQQFYVNNPSEAMVLYIVRAARRAEFARRFGDDGKKLDEMFQRMTQANMDPRDAELLKKIVDPILGRTTTNLYSGLAKAYNWIHAIGTMALLPRAVLSSLGEPVVAAVRSGQWADSVKVFCNQIGGIFNTKSSQDWREIAAVMGAVTNSTTDSVLQNRMGGTYESTPKLDRLLGNYFRRIFLHQLTNSQRVSTLPIAFEFVRLNTSRAIGPDKAKAAKAKILLRELGIDDAQLERFAGWLDPQNKTRPSIEELTNSPEGRLMQAAMGRFVDQVIQNPRGYDRPALADSPGGRLAYSILSFSMAFWNNVIKRQITLTREIKKEVGLGAAAGNAGMALASLTTLYIVQTIVSTAREAIFNPERWDELKEKGELGSTMLQLGFTRAFPLGLADPFIQTFTGLKYQRDFANIFIGNIPAYFSQGVQNTMTPFVRNSPNTDAAENRAMKGIYQTVIAPAMVTGLSYLPGGPALGALYGAAMMAGTSAGARDGFANLFYDRSDDKAKAGDRKTPAERREAREKARDKRLERLRERRSGGDDED